MKPALLPPVCIANELRPQIEAKGLRGLLRDMDIPSVLACLERDRLPIPAKENRMNYANDAHYWLFGFDDFRKVEEALRERNILAKRILDFGGATGRFFRHCHIQGAIDEIYSCDIKSANIDWCKANFPPLFKIFLNSAVPPLPFPDNHFDLIAAFSVFTHIDEGEGPWLAELSRILRPGGLAYLTVHDEYTWEKHAPALNQKLRDAPESVGLDFNAPMAFDRRVFHHLRALNVFHSQKYIQKHWGRVFGIETFVPFGHAAQTVVLARKHS